MSQILDCAGAHPVLAALGQISAALDEVAAANPVFMDTPAKTTALKRVAALEARMTELRLRITAAADDVAAQTAARDIASWATFHLHARVEDARADQALALALDRRYGVLAAAMRDGLVNHAQASVIARALDALPHDLAPELVAKAETTLIDHCGQYGPKTLARLGRRILEVVAPDLVDALEARRLAELEAEAHRRTKLSLRALGDGTTRISGLIPDAAAARLGSYLTAFTNPRVSTGATGSTTGIASSLGSSPRLPYPRKLGEAFCSLLEAVDPQRLPIHGGDATTLMVTISLADLRAELGAADLLPATDLPGDAETQITAAQARRLACMATIVPAVLGAGSEVLDLGRAQRLFTRAQRKALTIRDHHCRAQGCDIPAAWTEAHHLDPWSHGGATDLKNAVLLCSHHHHRAHDPGYDTQRLPNGDIRFHRRT
ncbi:MAG TPA: DUF222 domain-containing protein [Marmoricola sp.]